MDAQENSHKWRFLSAEYTFPSSHTHSFFSMEKPCNLELRTPSNQRYKETSSCYKLNKPTWNKYASPDETSSLEAAGRTSDQMARYIVSAHHTSDFRWFKMFQFQWRDSMSCRQVATFQRCAHLIRPLKSGYSKCKRQYIPDYYLILKTFLKQKTFQKQNLICNIFY